VQPLLQWEKNGYYIFWVCVCTLRYPACNVFVPYCCHLWPVRLYSIFPHYLTNGMIVGKAIWSTKCVFWFSLQLLSEIFLILRRNDQGIKNTYWSYCVNNQQDALYSLIYYSKLAIHVSGDIAHHHEHLTLFTVPGSVHPRCCWLCLGSTLPNTVDTDKCSWWWAKKLPETCKAG
jgi:hypothetical protein